MRRVESVVFEEAIATIASRTLTKAETVEHRSTADLVNARLTARDAYEEAVEAIATGIAVARELARRRTSVAAFANALQQFLTLGHTLSDLWTEDVERVVDWEAVRHALDCDFDEWLMRFAAILPDPQAARKGEESRGS